MITPAALIEQARALIGVPWLHQGRTSRGVDCIGLVLLSARNAGLDVLALCGEKDRRNYGRQASDELYSLVAKHCVQIPMPVAGAMVFFQFPKDSRPRHFGLYTETGTVVHAHPEIKRVTEHGYRRPWDRWTHSVWQLPGVTYG